MYNILLSWHEKTAREGCFFERNDYRFFVAFFFEAFFVVFFATFFAFFFVAIFLFFSWK